MDLLYRGHVDGFGIMSSRQRLPAARPADPRGRPAGLWLRHRQDARSASSRPAPASSTSPRSPATRTKRSRRRRPPKGQRAVDAELLQVLGAAFKASKRDEEGYASLSEMGQRAKAVSSFAVRNYGFTRLSRPDQGGAQFRGQGRRRRAADGQAAALDARTRAADPPCPVPLSGTQYRGDGHVRHETKAPKSNSKKKFWEELRATRRS